MRTIRLIGVHLKIAVLTEVQYRVNFFLSLAQSLMTIGTGLVVLTLIFRRVRELNGWSRPELYVVLGVFTILGGVMKMVIRPNIQRYIDDVREGTLDYALLKPVDAQLLVSIQSLQLWQGVDVVTGAILLGIGLAQVPQHVTATDAVMFAGALALSLVVIYCVLTVLGMSVFWLIQPHKILDMFDGIWQAGRWPVGIYPGWLRVGVTLVVPIGFSVTVPAEALLSRLTGGGLLGLATVSVLLFVFTRWFWRFCLRRYTGVSA